MHLTVTGWVGGVGGRPSPALGGPLSLQGVKWAASSQKAKRGQVGAPECRGGGGGLEEEMDGAGRAEEGGSEDSRALGGRGPRGEWRRAGARCWGDRGGLRSG